MPLLLGEKDVFEVKVRFVEKSDGDIEFVDNGKGEEATFVFRQPSWADVRTIMLGVVLMDEAGQAAIDPYKYSDAKLRTLLKDWSLTDAEGKKIPVTDANIDKMHPALFSHLTSQLSGVLNDKIEGPKGEAPPVPGKE